MSNNKQSSVEWLFNKLVLMNPNLIGFGDYLEQAKTMHEKQMVDFAYKHTDWGNPIDEIIKDYNETFNNDGNPNN